MQYQHSSVRDHNSTYCFLVKKGHNSKSIAFRVMLFVLQCSLSWWASIPSGVDTFNTFCLMGYIKVFAQWQQQLQTSDHNSFTFSSKQTNQKLTVNYQLLIYLFSVNGNWWLDKDIYNVTIIFIFVHPSLFAGTGSD